MNLQELAERIDQFIELMQRRKQVIDTILDPMYSLRQSLAALPYGLDPETEALICSVFTGQVESAQATIPDYPTDDGRTHFDKIAEYLNKVDGPRTVAEIESATGISRGSISNVLYKTHPRRFDSTETGNGRIRAWFLRPNEEIGETIPF